MRPLRRSPPRHRASSGAARLQVRRARAGQTGDEQPGPEQSGARHSGARHPEARQPEAQLAEASQPEASQPEVRLAEASQPELGVSMAERTQSEARQAKVGQPEVGPPEPEPPMTEPLELGQLQAEQLQAEQLQAKQPQAEQPQAKQAGDGHVRPALRRLMVTPTFAAGLGVVVAAGLAVGMTSRTVLHFSGPEGKPCAVRGCVSGLDRSPGAGTPASASPGKRLVPSTLGPGKSAQPSPSFTGGQGGEDSDHHSGRQVVIDYETTQRWSWGFDGQITISGLTDSALSSWRLGFNYPGTRIVGVQGAQWQSTGDDSGVAQAQTSSGGGQNGSDSGHGTAGGTGQDSSGHGGQQNTVVITIEASGTPSGPSDCQFDNTPCSFR
jgi:hypothetical protein